MGISGTHRRKTMWISPLLVTLLITGCASIKPYEVPDYREDGPPKGLFTGPEGEFIIYRKADEPEPGSEDTRRDQER